MQTFVPPFHPRNKPYASNRTKFFLIKSNSEKNVEISINYNVWATTGRNEAKFVKAFLENEYVVLVFSVNGSSKFCGYALMRSKPGESKNSNVYFYYDNQIFRGKNFDIQWIRKIDLNFQDVAHLKNSYNENKPIKVGRDGQEIEPNAGTLLCEVFEQHFLKYNNYFREENTSINIPPQPKTPQPKFHNQGGTPTQNNEGIIQINKPGYRYTNNQEPPPTHTNVNTDMKNKRNETEEELYNYYNPALHIFPIDLTNMKYDEYIEMYETSQHVWQQKINQIKQQDLSFKH